MWQLLLIAIVGFLAEIVDGSMGMGFGVISNTFLLTLGLGPAIASAIIHQAEVFTTLTAGISHFKMGNVDKRLLLELSIPGCVFGAIGAYLLSSSSIPGVKLLVTIYLFLIGGVIILRALGRNIVFYKIDRRVLGAIGGLLDAMGGGGWGPIVTSTLISSGENPRIAIGSVSLSEFFVTLSTATTFSILLGINFYYVIPFIVGGIMAAPLAAYLCKKIHQKKLMILVGITIMLTNLVRLCK